MGSKQSRWKTCSKHTVKIFGLAIGRLFVEETFDEEAKEHVSILPHCLKILKCGRPLPPCADPESFVRGGPTFFF